MATRMYPCGHTVCGPCANQIDLATRADSEEQARSFSCPLCRSTTSYPYSQRPQNHALEVLSRRHPDYARRRLQHAAAAPDDRAAVEAIGRHANLAAVCNRARRQLADTTFTELMHVVWRSASTGRTRVAITGDLVANAKATLDLIAARCFRNHNIYSIRIEDDLCVVHIVEEGTQLRSSYTNPSYVGGTEANADVRAAEPLRQRSAPNPRLVPSYDRDVRSIVLRRLLRMG